MGAVAVVLAVERTGGAGGSAVLLVLPQFVLLLAGAHAPVAEQAMGGAEVAPALAALEMAALDEVVPGRASEVEFDVLAGTGGAVAVPASPNMFVVLRRLA